MRRLILFALAAALCFATDPTIGGERYEQEGPQIVVPGYGFTFILWPRWTVTFACSSVDSTCTSANYTPDGTEVFSVSDTGLTATGLATLPYGSPFHRPRYKAINIVGAKFQLAMLSGGTFAETSFIKTAGTSSTSVPVCPDGSWPRIPNDGQGTGLFFSGNGASVQGRFQATTSGGVITSTSMIDGGGNFSSMPATGTLKCNTVAQGAVTSYTVTFSGGALATATPITGTGNATLVIISGGHGLGNIWLKDVAGKNWPSGTKMTYWVMNSSGSFQNLQSGIPGSGSMGMNTQQGIEVFIPASASPGVITAGWTLCNDSGGTTGCVDITKAVTVTALPTYKFVAPTPVALPSAFTSSSPVTCLTSPTGTPVAGTDCRFKTLLTSTAQNGYGFWCSLRQGTAPNSPDYLLELASSPNSMSWSSSLQSGPEYRQGWYYDGAKIYHKIAQFTGDYTWENCSLSYLSRYTQMGPGVPGVRPGVMNSGATLLPGNRVAYNTSGDMSTPQNSLSPFTIFGPERTFAPGMAIGLATFNNGNYITGPTPNHWSAQMVPPIYDAATNVGNWPSITVGDAATSTATVAGNAQIARYVAYQVDTKVEMGRNLGLTLRNSSGNLTRFGLATQIAREALWSYALQFANPPISGPYDNGPTGDQTWMIGGLMTEALISSYELWHDPMDLYALKVVLDLMNNSYDPVAHLIPVGNTPEGPYCAGFAWLRAGKGWYADIPDFQCNDDGPYPPFQPLNGMFAAAYAWWWKNFGGADATFANLADALALDGLIGTTTAGWRYAPKSLDEEFGRYGFDYYRWRQNR